MIRNFELEPSTYTPGQRLVCATLGVAGTISVTTSATLANVPTPMPSGGPMPVTSHGWQPNGPLSPWQAGPTGSGSATHWLSGSQGGSSSRSQSGGQSQATSALTGRFNGRPLSVVNSNAQVSGGNNLNLSSTSQGYLANNIANFKDLTIQVGGTREVVGLNTHLTAAEVVAVEQVLTCGSQTIKLSGSGAADGGTITLNNSLVSALDSTVGGSLGAVTIAHGVKVIDDVNQLSVGSLTNYGSLLTASSGPGNTDTISASTIANEAGGKISSFSGGTAGSGASGLYAADPSLNASVALTNNGTISSAGNLTLTAPTVSNLQSPTSKDLPSINAAQNVNINTANLNNAGVISAQSGNINVASSSALTVGNSGGTLQALNGNINMTSNNADLSVAGGNFYSQQVYLKAGEGQADFNVVNASGIVNASGDSVHLYTQSNLNVGAVDTEGDPLVSSSGDVTLTVGDPIATGGGDLTVVAGQNIVSFGGQINTSNTNATGGNGGNVTLIAGANFTVDGSMNVTITNSGTATNGSATGGYIDLTGVNGGTAPITSIVTTGVLGTANQANGGFVQMIAYGGTGKLAGQIILPQDPGGGPGTNVPLNAAGATINFASGDVLMIAGSTATGPTITTGDITARNVTLETFTPTLATPSLFIPISTGTVPGGTSAFTTSGKVLGGDIDAFGNISATGNVTSTSGGQFTNEGFQIFAIGPANTSNPLDGLVGKNITIQAGGDIFVGNLFSYGGGGSGSGSLTPTLNGGAGGNGGTITLTSTGGSVTCVGNINVSGGGGGGGAGGSETSTATLGGAGGQAGTVTINAAQNVSVGNTPAVQITAYNGGAGGNGGTPAGGANGGVGGGGGGGNAFGGGGGGGGAGSGNQSGEAATGGGGGFSGGISGLISGSGGGGGSSLGAGGGGTLTNGGGGGSVLGTGPGSSQGDSNGFNGGGTGNPAGGGGPFTNPPFSLNLAGGVGATVISTGGGGGQTTAAGGGGAGLPGGIATIGGTLNITSGGVISDGSGGPVLTEVGTLNVNSLAAVPSFTSGAISNTSGVNLNIGTANAGTSGTLTITNGPSAIVATNTGGAITVTQGGGGASGGTVTLTSAGTTSNNIQYLYDGAALTGTLDLQAGTGGTITTGATGIINTASANLTGPAGITVNTNVSNLTAVSSGGNVSVTQGATNLSLGASSANTGGTFTLTAGGSIAIAGGITVTNGSADLTAGSTGSITETSGTIVANGITMSAGASIGTAASPIQTKASNFISTESGTAAADSVGINDTSTGTLQFDPGLSSGVAAGSLTLTSTASQLNLIEAPYASVSITVSGATKQNVLINSGSSSTAVFGGSGPFLISTTGNIDVNPNTTALSGSSVSLETTGGSIGSLRQIDIAATTAVTLNAPQGSVNVANSTSGFTLNGEADTTSGTFQFSDTAGSGTALTIASAIPGNIIDISSTAIPIIVNAGLGGAAVNKVTVQSGGTLNVGASSTVQAATVSLSGVSNTVGTPAVTIGGSVTGPSISISSTGTDGDIVVNGTVGTAGIGTVNITSNAGVEGSKTGVIAGSTVNFTANTFVGSSGTNVDTSAGTITSASPITFISQTTGPLIVASANGIAGGNGTFSANVTGNSLEISGTLTNFGAINLTTTTSGTITTDVTSNINATAANSTVTITSAGDLTINGPVSGSSITASGGNLTISNTITGGTISVSASGTLTANGTFASTSPTGTSLGLSSGGALNTGSSSALGTVANPFASVTVNMTGAGAGDISGQVNTPTFQFLAAKGSTANLTIDTTATVNTTSLTVDTSKSTGAISLAGAINAAGTATVTSGSTLSVTGTVNDGTDTFSSMTTTTLNGSITDTSLGLSASGAVTIAGGAVTTGTGMVTAASLSNLGTLTGTTSLAVTTSGAAGISNGGTGQIKGGAITLSATGMGTISNLAGGIINVASLTLNTTSFSNLGTTNASTALTIQNTSGNLSITGTSGNLTAGPLAAILLNAKGTITSGTTGQANDPLAGLQGNSYTVTAGGNFTTALTGFTVNAGALGNGGTIDIAVSNIVFNGTGSTPNWLLQALGTTGSGGIITLDLPGTATNGLTVGGAGGTFNIAANGKGGGGTVNLTTPGQLSVNTGNLAITATKTGSTGASVNFSGTKGVLITGTLDTRFSPTDLAGNITITSGSKNVFAIGGPAGTTNGQIVTNGGLFGSVVTINNASGVSVAATDTLSGSSSVTINGTTLLNSNIVATPSLTISSAGTVTVNASTGTYTGLTSFDATSTGGNLTVTGATPNAGDVTLSAVKGSITFGSGITSITAVQSDAKQDGGTIDILAKTLTFSTTGLKLDAAATAGMGGNGGTIDVDLSGTTNLLVGTGKSALTVLAQNDSTGTANGNITLITGGNLTITAQPANFNVGTLTGSGSVVLAGKALSIGGSPTFVGNQLTNLSLTSNTGTAFALGGAKANQNGIAAAGLSYEAGTIQIINTGGGITQGTANSIDATSGTGVALTLTGKSGLGLTGKALQITEGGPIAMQLNSSAGSAYISISGTPGTTTYGATVAGTLQINTVGSLAASGTIGAKALNLTATSLPSFTTNASSITANATSAVSGSITITDTQTGLLTLNVITAAQGISIATSGAITAAQAITANGTGSVSLNAGGAVTTKGAITSPGDITIDAGGATGSISLGASANAGSDLTLEAAGKGTITETKTTIIAGAADASLITQATTSGGSIGTSATTPFKVDAAILQVTGAGTAANVYVNDSAASVALGSSSGGKLFSYTGNLTGGTPTITTPTLVLNNSGNTATISTNAASIQAVATTGNITINDTSTALVKLNTLTASAGTGTVAITSNGAITTAGVITGPAGVSISDTGSTGTITIGKNITSQTGLISLGAGGTGAIVESSGLLTGTGVSLTTASGNIGSSSKAVTTSTSSISTEAGTSGNVFLTNTDTNSKGAVILNTVGSVGSIKLTDTNKTAKNTGTLTLNSIAANGVNGNIFITTNEQQLNVNTVSDISTQDGNITLQNTYTANGANLPSINIGLPTTALSNFISAVGLAGTTNGNVFIALGTVPTISSLKAGVAPTGGTPGPVITTTGVTVFFGTTSNPNGSITTNNNDMIKGTNADVSFTTGKNAASQIVLGENVTITGDPPPAASTNQLTVGALSAGGFNLSTSGSSPIGASTAAQNASQTTSSGSAANQSFANLQTLTGSDSQPLGGVLTGGVLTAAALAGQVSDLNASTLLAATSSLTGLSAITSNESGNVSTAISNNAVSSIGQVRSNCTGLQADQTNFIATSPVQMITPKVLKGSASNVARQTLDRGPLLFNSDKDTVIDTPYGAVSVEAGSVVLVVVSDDGLSVYNLHDSRKGAVSLLSDKESVLLTPGNSVVLTNSTKKSFDQVNATQFVGYRNIVSRDSGAGAKLYSAEFDLVSMMHGLKPLRDMFASDNQSTRKAMAKMLKTAVIMSGLTQGGQTFALHATPPLTSYATETGRQ